MGDGIHTCRWRGCTKPVTRTTADARVTGPLGFCDEHSKTWAVQGEHAILMERAFQARLWDRIPKDVRIYVHKRNGFLVVLDRGCAGSSTYTVQKVGPNAAAPRKWMLPGRNFRRLYKLVREDTERQLSADRATASMSWGRK